MEYNVHRFFHIGKEALLSLLLYKRTANLKYLHVGTKWVEEVDKIITKELQAAINEVEDFTFFDLSDLLMVERPENDDMESYFSWLSGLGAGELYERFSPFLDKKQQLPRDLLAAKEQYIQVLSKWYEQYCLTLDTEVWKSLKRAHEMNSIEEEPKAFVDRYSKGIRLESEGITDVYMTPCYHFRPLPTVNSCGSKFFIIYPLEDDLTYQLTTIGKALSDQRRLEILAFLATGEYTFTDIVKNIGGTKGNIHHHIITLRSIGLIHTHYRGENCTVYYSLRKEPVERLSGVFGEFLGKKNR